MPYYQSTDIDRIEQRVANKTDEIMKDLGMFPLDSQTELLTIMAIFSQAIMFLGLVLDIIILLFIVMSVLLIYSLLLISVESKSFEFGVQRMVGLSKSGIIWIILIQGLMFVAPSILIAFPLSYPILVYCNQLIFSDVMGVEMSGMPSNSAIA